MDSYFYCTYEHAKDGFVHARLEGEHLQPVAGGHLGLPESLRDFFSYDRFLLLWRELAPPVARPWHHPQPHAAFFGLRDLRGVMPDGRGVTVNWALYATESEIVQLRRAALSVLGDFDAFQAKLFIWLSVGGPCGYSLDGAAYLSWLESCVECSRLRLLIPQKDPVRSLLPYLQQTQPPHLERDLLHLAVSTVGWKELSQSLDSSVRRQFNPHCVLSKNTFQTLFSGRGPIWQLESGN